MDFERPVHTCLVQDAKADREPLTGKAFSQLLTLSSADLCDAREMIEIGAVIYCRNNSIKTLFNSMQGQIQAAINRKRTVSGLAQPSHQGRHSLQVGKCGVLAAISSSSCSHQGAITTQCCVPQDKVISSVVLAIGHGVPSFPPASRPYRAGTWVHNTGDGYP